MKKTLLILAILFQSVISIGAQASEKITIYASQAVDRCSLLGEDQSFLCKHGSSVLTRHTVKLMPDPAGYLSGQVIVAEVLDGFRIEAVFSIFKYSFRPTYAIWVYASVKSFSDKYLKFEHLGIIRFDDPSGFGLIEFSPSAFLPANGSSQSTFYRQNLRVSPINDPE
jgi:hypothetical protein